MNLAKSIIASIFLLMFFSEKTSAQGNLDIGIFENPVGSGILEIRVRPTQNFTGLWSSTVFTIRWLDSYGTSLTNPTSSFFINKDDGEFTAGGFRYQKFTHNIFHSVNWTAGQEIVVMTITHDGNGNGTGVFELANDGWTGANNGDHYQEYGGADHTGIIYQPSASVALPIELLNFQAKKSSDNSLLTWQTETELNNAFFDIQHSTDGKVFHKIGRVVGAGTTTQTQNYTHTHLRPGSGLHYYRLKQVDFDGQFDYSPIVSLEMGSSDQPFTLFPNPNNGHFTLNIQNPVEQPVTARLIDTWGQVVWEAQLSSGVWKLGEEAGLASGIYSLQIMDGHKMWSEKVVVQK